MINDQDRVELLRALERLGPDVLKDADYSLRADREVIFEAVKENGMALEYANDNLKADRDVVLAAVKQNGSALEYAGKYLKADREVVLEAIKNSEGSEKVFLKSEKNFHTK